MRASFELPVEAIEWNFDRMEAEHRLFSFLICEANGIVGPVRLRAMPVLLTTPEHDAAMVAVWRF